MVYTFLPPFLLSVRPPLKASKEILRRTGGQGPQTFLSDYTDEELDTACRPPTEEFRISPNRSVENPWRRNRGSGTMARTHPGLQGHGSPAHAPPAFLRPERETEKYEVVILVATSGTRGRPPGGLCRRREGAHLGLLSHGGVSEIQRLQMVTQRERTWGLRGQGNFDDAQTGSSRFSPIRPSTKTGFLSFPTFFCQFDQLGTPGPAGRLLLYRLR